MHFSILIVTTAVALNVGLLPTVLGKVRPPPKPRPEILSHAGSLDLTPAPIMCSQKNLTVTILTDNYPSEISWKLRNKCTGEVVAYQDEDYYASPHTPYSHEYCIPAGQYNFTMYDSYGDGICCDGELQLFYDDQYEYTPPYYDDDDIYVGGSYAVQYDGNQVASGGDYGFGESTVFGPLCPAECDIEKMKGNYKLRWDVYDHNLGTYKEDLVRANLRVRRPDSEGNGKGVMQFSMCTLVPLPYFDSMVAVQTGFACDGIISILIGTSFAGEYNCETEELMFGTSYNEDNYAFSLKKPAVKNEGGVGFPGDCRPEN